MRAPPRSCWCMYRGGTQASMIPSGYILCIADHTKEMHVMSKKTVSAQPVRPADEHDHSHPILPLILVSVLGVAILALLLRAFGIF